jgi:hypothetical protein
MQLANYIKEKLKKAEITASKLLLFITERKKIFRNKNIILNKAT